MATRVVVRVLDGDGEPVGAGFLVGPDMVATCAHVVASALGGDPYSPTAPTHPVRVDFPLFRDLGSEVPTAVSAEVHRWHPIATDGSGDIAVLQLRRPAPAGMRMPPLRRVDRLWDHAFRVLGFPAGLADGVWATGRIRGEQGTRWQQLQSAVGDQPIVEGFSGSPVWDEETGAVVGMTVATDASGTTTTAYLIPIDQVLGVDPGLLPCPYRGLEPFGEEHAPYYFGRDADIALLVDAVAKQPLVAVAGPSGAGKSSLVRAGLLPLLRAEGNTVTELRPLRGRSAMATLTAALRPGPVPEASPVPEAGTGPEAFTADDIGSLAAEAARTRTVLVLDQFEELAAADPQAAQELLGVLGALVRAVPPDAGFVRVVLTLRSAALDDVAARDVAALLTAGTVLLPPMDRTQLRDAIVAPAERAPGLSFEPGLVDRILDDAAAEPGQLPLVESLLTELWERRDGGHLTLAAYERSGGVAGVVATHAENVVARFTDPADEPRLRRLFTALAVPDRDGRFVRRAMPLHELAPDLLPLVRALAAGRLMVVERDPTGFDQVQLAHQALIAHWPRLQDWLAADKAFLAWRDQLDQQRKRWESAGRDDGSLLRGTALAGAQEWLPQRSMDVSAPGLEYVRQSTARQRREVRRWRVITAVLAVLGLAAATLAAVTISSRNQIGDQLRLANAEIVAQAALARSGSDPVVATQLAVTAWRLNPTNATARTALLRQFVAMRSVVAVYPQLASTLIVSYAASDDMQNVALVDGDGIVVVSGLPENQPRLWSVPGVPQGLNGVGISRDGKQLRVADRGGALWSWDLATRAGPARLPVTAEGAEPASVITNGPDRVLWQHLTGPGVHTVEIRDIGTGAAIPHGIAPIASPEPVTITSTADPNQIFLQTGGTGSTPSSPLVLRSVADGAELRSFPAGSRALKDGTVLSCEQQGERTVAVVRDARQGTELRRIALLRGCSATNRLNLTLDDGHLLELHRTGDAADNRIAKVTRLTDGRGYEAILPPDPQSGGATSADVPMRVLAGADDAITLLLAQGNSLLRLRAPLAPPDAIAALPLVTDDDERFLVNASDSGYAVYDRDYKQLAALPTSAAAGTAGSGRGLITDALSVLVRTPTEWTTSEFSLPALTRTSQHVLPQAGQAPRANAAVVDGRVITFGAGVIAVWDRKSGLPVHEPVRVATTLDEQAWYRSRAEFVARPRHPDQIAVLGPDNVPELWDIASGKRLATFPVLGFEKPYDLTFDPSGSRLVALTLGVNVKTWDADTQQAVGRPFPIPGGLRISDITEDGSVITQGTDKEVLTFWDLGTGSKTASVTLPQQYFYDHSDDRHRVLRFYGVNGALPPALPRNGQQWFDWLCAMSDRPPTPGEQRILPAGVAVDRPCAP